DGRPVPRSFAEQLLTVKQDQTLDTWLAQLPMRSLDPEKARGLVDAIQGFLGPPANRQGKAVPRSLTYRYTARRSFEVAYWKSIADLATGRFLNKNNADCVRDPATQRLLADHCRHLEMLGDHLLAHYRGVIAEHHMTGKAMAGDLPFEWRTDF